MKFHNFLADLAPKVLLVFAICEISPSSTCSLSQIQCFAVSFLVSGEIFTKFQSNNHFGQNLQMFNLTFAAYILVYLVNTHSLVCICCTYCVVLCK